MENDAITGRNGASQCPSTICAAPSLDGGGARGTEGAPRRGDARSRSRSSRSRSPPLAPFILARGSDAMSGEAVRLPPYTGPPPFFIAPSCRAGGAPNEDACTWDPVGVDARPGPARCGEAEYPGPGSDPERACFPGPTGDKGRGFGLCRRTMTSAICNRLHLIYRIRRLTSLLGNDAQHTTGSEAAARDRTAVVGRSSDGGSLRTQCFRPCVLAEGGRASQSSTHIDGPALASVRVRRAAIRDSPRAAARMRMFYTKDLPERQHRSMMVPLAEMMLNCSGPNRSGARMTFQQPSVASYD